MSLEASGGAAAVHPILGGGGRRGLREGLWLAVLIVLLIHAAVIVLLSRMGVIQTPLTPTPDEQPLVLVSPSTPPPPPTPVRQPHARTQQIETVRPTASPPANTQTVELPASSQPRIEGPTTIAEPPKTPPETATTPEPTSPPVIGQPHWLSQPNAAEMARFYPPPALDDNVEGRAVIRCTVAVSGTLTACAIVQEQPRGYGFGRAALQLSPYFRMTPRTEDGRPVGGASVEVAIQFKL